MGYRQHFRDSVAYSGSMSVHYPKSDSGGVITKSFSGYVPVDIVVDVDTEPFDAGVSDVNRNIGVLNGAVITMNAAQCAAIMQTTKEVSAALINGFFGTINSELSQQLQMLDSAIKAGFALLLEQAKAIDNQKNTLETDYDRICSRYIALFQNLDTECYKQIHALDKPSFSLSAYLRKKLLSDGSDIEKAKIFTGMEDEASSTNLIMVSGLLRKLHDVLHTLYAYITQETHLSSLVECMLDSENPDTQKTLCVPVVCIESDALEGSSINRECMLADCLNTNTRNSIAQDVMRECSDARSYPFPEVEDGEREVLTREFNALAEMESGESSEQKRVYDTLMTLWRKDEAHSAERRK